MEENEKKEEKGGRKKIIKSVAIVFIVVLLLLTFFSNTIMNYSLPEVSTTTVSSGSVSQKVRCQGTVETAKDVEVTVSGERTVKEVLVESGDEVKKGQTLVTFDETENPELKRAENELKDLERAQEKAQLTMDKDYTEDYIDIEKAKETIADAEKALNDAKAAEASVAAAQEEVEAAQSRVDSQKAVVTEIQTQFDSLKEAYNYNEVKEEIATLSKDSEDLQPEIDRLNKEIEDLTAQLNDPAYADQIETIQNKINEDNIALQDAVSKKAQIDASIESKQNSIADVEKLAETLGEESAELESLNTALENAKTAATAAEGAPSVKDAEKTLKDAQEAYDTKLRAFEKTKQTDALEAQKDAIDKKKELEDIEAKRKEVEKLKDADDTAAIVAPADGIITGITLKEGDKVSTENPIATIQLAESGYEVSATIPKADGQLIHVGDEAYLENVWSADASGTVKSIKADPNDPNKSLIVKFEVKGSEISIGQTIQFAVGEKSQRYDCIVPNNAVKEDSKGNFVLVVKVKSTPLGNRYVVKRVDVKKVASDTTKCAIQGDVAENDNIVTNSTKRLENGQQVRLSEKQ